MLMVLPSGMEKLDTDLEAPSFCTESRLEERAAADEQVEKEIMRGSERPFRNVLGVRPENLAQGR